MAQEPRAMSDAAPEDIRAGMRDTRARVDQTLGEIAERLSPGRVARDAGEAVSEQGRRIAAAVRRGATDLPTTIGRAAGYTSAKIEQIGTRRAVAAAAGVVAGLVAGARLFSRWRRSRVS